MILQEGCQHTGQTAAFMTTTTALYLNSVIQQLPTRSGFYFLINLYTLAVRRYHNMMQYGANKVIHNITQRGANKEKPRYTTIWNGAGIA
jgi:hypothetical protein